MPKLFQVAGAREDAIECLLTILLNGRPPLLTRTGPRTNCKRAHGAATLLHGPFQ
jgi:hypothetical protein